MEKKIETRLSRPAMGKAEQLVTVLACAWAVVFPWLIGGRLWWAQALGAVLGWMALVAVMGTSRGRKNLLRFPVFWLGLLFLAYVACQALNPWGAAIPLAPGLFIWELTNLPYKDWLPAGLRADYFEMSTWRALVYWTGPWLLACGWWAGVQSRRSARWLWAALFGNSVVISIETFVDYFHRSNKILWFYVEHGLNEFNPRATNDYTFVGAFATHNPGAMYLYLGLAAGFALALHWQVRAHDTGKDNGLGWVILLGCAAILAGIIISGSRAGIVAGLVIVTTGLLLLMTGAWREDGRGILRLIPGLVFVAVLLAALGIIFTTVEPRALMRLTAGMPSVEEDARFSLMGVTVKMIKSRPWLGYGGGTYRYVSPGYFWAEGLFMDPEYQVLQIYRANHAHSDWLQLTMEYGVVGAGLLLAILLYWAGRACRLARWLGPSGWVVMVAVGLMLLHAGVDFPFYNAAVLTAFTLLVVSAIKAAELNRQHDLTV